MIRRHINALTVLVAVMQLIGRVIHAVTVMTAVIVMVAASSGFSKSTNIIGPYRIDPHLQDLPTHSEFTQHVMLGQTTKSRHCGTGACF
jgi:hypothetical protein